MADSVQASHKPIVRVKWSAAVPGRGSSIESDIFHLQGKAWKFKFEAIKIEMYGTDELILYIKKCDSVGINERFCLIAYFRDGASNFYMTHTAIPSDTGKIWSYARNTFFAAYPNLKNAKVLDFSFVIVNLSKVSRSFVNERKSAQTPSPIVPPSYSEDRPCLDNLSLALRKLVDGGSDSDVQLKCGECSMAGHALILGMRSEVFRTMLQSDMQEGRKGAIEIVDMEPKAFEIFIRYLYTGTLPELTEDTATSLYQAADKYLVEALRQRCGDFLAGNLTRENALRILAMADARSDKDLKDKVGTYVLIEEIPGNEDEWSKFCEDYPKLANEVLNRAYKYTTYVL